MQGDYAGAAFAVNECACLNSGYQECAKISSSSAGDIHRRPNRQEFIGCLRNLRAPFAFAQVQRVLQPMEIQNVVRGVFELRFRQFRRPPIGGLLPFERSTPLELTAIIREARADPCKSA